MKKTLDANVTVTGPLLPDPITPEIRQKVVHAIYEKTQKKPCPCGGPECVVEQVLES